MGDLADLATPAGIVTARLKEKLKNLGQDPDDNLKIQKLLYFVHAWCLALLGVSPLPRNCIQAWRHGPVCPEIYRAMKDGDFLSMQPQRIEIKNAELIIDLVAEHYGVKNSVYLSNRTHKEAPWATTFDESRDKPIPDDKMKKYYKNPEIANHILHGAFLEDFFHRKDSVPFVAETL